jgi:hypothetical protein
LPSLSGSADFAPSSGAASTSISAPSPSSWQTGSVGGFVAGRTGLEPAQEARIQQENSQVAPTDVDARSAELGRNSAIPGRPVTIRDDSNDLVESALAGALGRASGAGEWSVVATLARELEARRKAREGR